MSRQYLTTGKIAYIWGCSTEWVRNQIRKGNLRAQSRLEPGEHYRVPIEEFEKATERLGLFFWNDRKVRIIAKHLGISKRYAKKLCEHWQKEQVTSLSSDEDT